MLIEERLIELEDLHARRPHVPRRKTVGQEMIGEPVHGVGALKLADVGRVAGFRRLHQRLVVLFLPGLHRGAAVREM